MTELDLLIPVDAPPLCPAGCERSSCAPDTDDIRIAYALVDCRLLGEEFELGGVLVPTRPGAAVATIP